MDNQNIADQNGGLLLLDKEIEEPLSPEQKAELARKVNDLPIVSLVKLASQWNEDFQPIHRNIRDFYLMGGSMSSDQKAVMVEFILDHDGMQLPEVTA